MWTMWKNGSPVLLPWLWSGSFATMVVAAGRRQHDQRLDALGEGAFHRSVYECIKETCRRKVVTALRKFIEVDNDDAFVSVKLLDQQCVVNEWVGPAFNMVDYKDAAVKQGPEEITLRVKRPRHHED